MRKLLFLLSIFAVVLSCSSDETSTPVTPPAPIVKYTITLSAGEGGTVSTTGGEYEAGQTVSVTASPKEGYLFIDWSDGNTDPTRTITVNTNTYLIANFSIKFFELSVEKEKDYFSVETISGEKHSEKQNHYSFGTILKISFKDFNGLVYKNVSGDIDTNKRSFNVVINKDFIVKPNYLKGTWINLNIKVQIKDKDVIFTGKDFPLQNYQDILLVRKEPLEIIDLDSGEIIWQETSGQPLFSLPSGNGGFDEELSFIIPPGNYRIKNKGLAPDDALNEQFGLGINYFRGGYHLPSYIDQEFSVIEGEEDKILNLTAYIPDFILLTFDETELTTEFKFSVVEIDENQYSISNSFSKNTYMSSDNIGYRHWYVPLERLNRNNSKLYIEFRLDGTNIRYPVENLNNSRGHLHFKILEDEYGYPYFKEESLPKLILREAANNPEKFEYGFIKIKEFSLINESTFFPNNIIGDSIPKWNYNDLFKSNSKKIQMYFDSKKYSIRTDFTLPERQKEINLNFIPLDANGNAYYRSYISIDGGNGFRESLDVSFNIEGRYKELDFNNKITSSDKFIFSLPKEEGYDVILVYNLYDDFNKINVPEESGEYPYRFRTKDGLVAQFEGSMVLNEEYYYRFMSDNPISIDDNPLLFKGVLIRGFKNNVLIKENTFKTPNYIFQGNNHYNYNF